MLPYPGKQWKMKVYKSGSPRLSSIRDRRPVMQRHMPSLEHLEKLSHLGGSYGSCCTYTTGHVSTHLNVLSTPSKEKHLGGFVPFKMLLSVYVKQEVKYWSFFVGQIFLPNDSPKLSFSLCHRQKPDECCFSFQPWRTWTKRLLYIIPFYISTSSRGFQRGSSVDQCWGSFSTIPHSTHRESGHS